LHHVWCKVQSLAGKKRERFRIETPDLGHSDEYGPYDISRSDSVQRHKAVCASQALRFHGVNG
jgi:hypothetical protein